VLKIQMKTLHMTLFVASRSAIAAALVCGSAAVGCGADSHLQPVDDEGIGTQNSAISTPGWIGTWGTAPQASGSSFPAQTTLRQTVHTSVAGSSLRLQLSNVFGTQAITISNVHVARPTDSTGAAIDPATDRQVTFAGQTSVTIPAGQSVASDSVNYAVSALSNVTVSFYLPQATGPSTYNWLSSQNNYYYVGSDAAQSASLPSGKVVAGQYFFLTGVDVQNSAATGAIAALGASITNGFGSPTNANQRWPDYLAARINSAGMTIGVLNEGISGNMLLVDNSWGPSQSALGRFSRDVTDQSGVKWVVMSDDPINDITNGNTNGSSLIAGYQQIISNAHDAGLKIICSTLTPFQGWGAWSSAGEAARAQVNSFVRGAGNGCDAILDQDNATHDPNNPTWFLPAYDTGDHLHPNAAGFQAIANAFPLSVLAGGPYGGTPQAIPGVIQAANYDLGGEGVGYHDNDAANLGGQYRLSEGVDIENAGDTGGGYDVGWINGGEWLKYTVNVASSGSYSFVARAASPGGSAQFQIEVDQTNVTGPITVNATGGWQTYQNFTSPSVSLTAGPHVIRIYAITGGFNLTKVTASSVGGPYGGTPQAIPGVIQAANYDLGGEGVGYHDNDAANLGGQYRLSEGVDIENAGDTGGGYDVGWINGGEWLKYTVNVASSGSYSFVARAASPGGSAQFQLEVDQTNVTGPITVNATGGWQTYQNFTSPSVSLTAGPHVIRIYAITGGFNLTKVTASQVGTPSSCQALRVTNQSLASGQYTIDPGTGAISVYCDMTFSDGTATGGWTLVESIQANNSPSNTLAGSVTPGTTTAMPLATVKALAALSAQVHIRTPGMASTQSITSLANSSPIVHLRAGNILNDLADSQQHQNWTGPFATAAYLDFSCATAGYTWPSVYWACGNASGLTLVTAWSEWKFSDNAKAPFEVYVR
jgi:lysophospholipase L1-like esterase